jgi:hypothetical protein
MAACVDSAATGIACAPGCLVLRVKRKREEDPAEALVVTKHTKLDAPEVGASVFRFVGTLGEEDGDRVILDRLKHYRDRADDVKSLPFAKLSLEDTRAQRREAVKAKSSAQRFKVMSQLRCLQYSGADKRTATVATPCAGGGERVHICDAMQESGKEERQTVTCNDTTMVREKVVQKSGGFVYDLYYTHEPVTFDMETATFDWSSLSVYESELVHDIIDDEEILDDEDDSNDEDNWRNDYPDEEESPHSSDSESGRYWKRHGVDGSFDNDEYMYGMDDDYL